MIIHVWFRICYNVNSLLDCKRCAFMDMGVSPTRRNVTAQPSVHDSPFHGVMPVHLLDDDSDFPLESYEQLHADEAHF